MNKPQQAPAAGLGWQIALWTAQTLSFVAFTGIGLMKVTMPVAKLAAMWVWPGQVPVWFLRGMGLIDIAGGVGVLLPALVRIRPRLVVAAAFWCAVLQVCAIAFHAWRGEYPGLPLNAVLLALSLFIYWGRRSRAPSAA